ncbi:phosphoribosylformylglycinamidine synthase [Candidatus Tachikawaea gelatinosa]|uniref:Phosphoribosylformylglycinamidine synthase n=1 Tax=Candidatus Tachikawaea gelatinosa TaxID=1410383 RepID=A0A090BWG2_9ENTR|nr:phosphoribosylformylglycinamidine synthase [Candidatus Tachikawaea gelatinosa]BAP58551.1 phosphoribosylformylglycinamidine synthase [Candidatus Tachikawaea gelatinosa]
MIEILHGLPVLSHFFIKKILNRIKITNISVKNIYAKYLYFLDLKKSLNTNEKKRLKKILQIDSFYEKETSFFKHKFLVLPRIGTISSWSSKATDIVKNCQIDSIKRLEKGVLFYVKNNEITDKKWKTIAKHLYDSMTETITEDFEKVQYLFKKQHPSSFREIDICSNGIDILKIKNLSMQLNLSIDEINYFFTVFNKLKRNPTDVEFYMFAQINSEHCRHKIFNAKWIINGIKKHKSPFSMIKNTFKMIPNHIISAYIDNSAIMEGSDTSIFQSNYINGIYEYQQEKINIAIKVETHNHPTSISPWEGSATGAGGEIRDLSSTGKGAKPKAGLSGFSVSNLFIPKFIHPWEKKYNQPKKIASALNIMIEGPLGCSSYNNKFGRPVINGYFRTYEEPFKNSKKSLKKIYGYHKPIMLSGGIGSIINANSKKMNLRVGDKLIILGGPSMKIGLGGSTASSSNSYISNPDLDFSSVQRDDPEMERRCQEVIDKCWQLGKMNPILFIHDIGAGGIANAIVELIMSSGYGGLIDLRKIPTSEDSMNPLELLCNESQERYAIAIDSKNLEIFFNFCKRERAPYAVIGEITNNKNLVIFDKTFNNLPVNIPLYKFLKKIPRKKHNVRSLNSKNPPLSLSNITLNETIKRILYLPSVAEKSFLITIADRTVTGMVVRDQMIGPWQIPVSNCAVTTSSFDSYYGEAFSIGERSPISLINASAAARMSLGEAITNIAAVHIGSINRIKCSANWMIASGRDGEDEKLYEAIKSISEDICPKLGITIPVGKDSMSMTTYWKTKNESYEMISPVSIVITAFARVEDVRNVVTPELQLNNKNLLLLIDLGRGHNALGATSFSQVYNKIGDKSADIRNVQDLAKFFSAIQYLCSTKKILAYHDRSDGGLFVTLLEMAFAGHCGLNIDVSELGKDLYKILFNEELGAVIQINYENLSSIKKIFSRYNILDCVHVIGYATSKNNDFTINFHKQTIYKEKCNILRMLWAETSWRIQRLRDNEKCADEEFYNKKDEKNPGLHAYLTFKVNEDIAAPAILTGIRPKLAVLREQGINSHIEMAAAFHRAGFEAIDVHMNDLLSARFKLEDFHMIVACGGFSYGDVLGAGMGWAHSILSNKILKKNFKDFFHRKDTLSLGVCNGCQMFSHLSSLIPDSSLWPNFCLNKSGRFESRFVLVKVMKSPSLILNDMVDSHIPIPVSHSEGYVKFKNHEHLLSLESSGLIALRYIDNYGKITEKYPFNPNGSSNGITAISNKNGQVTIMMPHPERVFRTINNSWYPEEWGEDGPWMRLFRNSRKQLC